MTKSQYKKPGLQTIAIDILPNISQSKDHQTMKFGQLIENKKRKIYLEKYTKNKAGKVVPDLSFDFSKITCYEMKASGLQLSFDILR